MELQFKTMTLDCLESILQEPQTAEQTQEIRLSEGMPDVGKVVCAWGQCIVRAKEWHSDFLSCSGGMMVWVLYTPEDGSREQVISTWIPFQMRWELPEGTPEGVIRLSCISRLVDARSVSPRKIMVRAGMSALVQVLVPRSAAVCVPGEDLPGVELLRTRYPLRVRKTAGEKTFLLDEELSLPDSAPKLSRIVYCVMEPKLTDSRVVSDKLVFRGNGNLHMLYQSDTGQLHTWDFPLPFSQYAELNQSFSTDAQADLMFGITSLEPDVEENGMLRLKSGVVGQYVVHDREMIELAEDAYSPNWELELRREELELPVLLENRRENIYGEQTIQADANVAVDTRFQPDFPRRRRNGDQTGIVYPGVFQSLYYGPDGTLNAGTARWEEERTLPAGEDSALLVLPGIPEAQAMAGNGSISLKAELPVETTASALQRIPMLTSVMKAQEKQLDPARPSLILARAGKQSLWDIAKASGSTVGAIRNANGLQEEPLPEQMLLIPVT